MYIDPGGIVSTIGAIERTSLKINKIKLMNSLANRFKATSEEVLNSIKEAKKLGILKDFDEDTFQLVLEK